MKTVSNANGSSQDELPLLIDRICGTPLCGTNESRKFVFLLGAAMSCQDTFGVPDAAQMTAAILAKLKGSGTLTSQPTGYQQAFAELLRVRGPEVAQQLLREQVLKAYDRERSDQADYCHDEKKFGEIEADELGWNVPRGTRALGRIIAEFSERFEDLVLTTNFDPLITIALRLAHCHTTQTLLSGDGNPAQTLVKGCHVVHLHGYWYRRDAQHTVNQLLQGRPMLKAYLKDIIKKYTIIVVGYSGWDDLFTTAIREVSIEQNAEPDILWTFFRDTCESKQDQERIRKLMPEAYGQGRAQFYSGIDCHSFFPTLLTKLREPARSKDGAAAPTSKAITFRSKPQSPRRRGIIREIRWNWVAGNATHSGANGRDADAVVFGKPRPVEWFTTRRSLVIEEVPPQADWQFDQKATPKQLCLFGALTGGRHMASLFDEEANDGIDADCLTRVEIPWQSDNEDSLFSCKVQPTGEHAVAGVAALLEPSDSHVPSDSMHLTPKRALDGVWLKISAAGGIFVVKLHLDFSLTEHLIQIPRETWSGEWALNDGHLVVRFGGVRGWELITRLAPEPPQATIKLQEWGIFAGTERQYSTLETTPFLVVHVPPLPTRSGGISTHPGNIGAAAVSKRVEPVGSRTLSEGVEHRHHAPTIARQQTIRRRATRETPRPHHRAK